MVSIAVYGLLPQCPSEVAIPSHDQISQVRMLLGDEAYEALSRLTDHFKERVLDSTLTVVREIVVRAGYFLADGVTTVHQHAKQTASGLEDEALSTFRDELSKLLCESAARKFLHGELMPCPGRGAVNCANVWHAIPKIFGDKAEVCNEWWTAFTGTPDEIFGEVPEPVWGRLVAGAALVSPAAQFAAMLSANLAGQYHFLRPEESVHTGTLCVAVISLTLRALGYFPLDYSSALCENLSPRDAMLRAKRKLLQHCHAFHIELQPEKASVKVGTNGKHEMRQMWEEGTKEGQATLKEHSTAVEKLIRVANYCVADANVDWRGTRGHNQVTSKRRRDA